MDAPPSASKPPFLAYAYVGPKRILAQTDLKVGGTPIHTLQELQTWVEGRAEDSYNGFLTATFIISEQETLVLSGRHTEHVMCAKGQPVLSAGEIVFELGGKEPFVYEISNQSTGYCPKPESWSAVDWVLRKIGVAYPNAFSRAYEFRYCENCHSINLIKEELYECSVCGSELSREWNFNK